MEALPPKQWKVIPEADYDNPKYAIDRLVQAHRQEELRSDTILLL